MKNLIANWLVMFVVIGSVLSSPAIMASSMQSAVQGAPVADACALCQLDASDQPQTASGTTTCAAAACAMFASMNSAELQAVQSISAMRVASVCVHYGRLLEGPDPFPPRHSNA